MIRTSKATSTNALSRLLGLFWERSWVGHNNSFESSHRQITPCPRHIDAHVASCRGDMHGLDKKRINQPRLLPYAKLLSAQKDFGEGLDYRAASSSHHSWYHLAKTHSWTEQCCSVMKRITRSFVILFAPHNRPASRV